MNFYNRTLEKDVESGVMADSLDDSEASPKAKWLNKLSKAAIPATLLLLLFLSRPLIGLAARNTCYYFQDDVGIWPNPLRWAIHHTTSMYKCEWIGHWGFNWLGTLGWLGEKGTSLFAPLSIIGGSYATWKSIKSKLGFKNMSPEDKEKLRELSELISVKDLEQGQGRQVSFSKALRFSDSRDLDSSIDCFSPHESEYEYNRRCP